MLLFRLYLKTALLKSNKAQDLLFKIRVMDNVTGTINKTVVTLSKNADPTAVNRDSNNKMRIGFPPAAFAALMATNSKTPD